MARTILVNFNFNKNEIQNARLHNLASQPASPGVGQIFFDTALDKAQVRGNSGWLDLTFTYGTVTSTLAFGGTGVVGSSAKLAREDHTHTMPAHDAAAHSGIRLNNLAAATADYSMGGFKITNLGPPSASTDAVNKQYVDDARAGLDSKDSVVVATTANITLSGTQTIDGIAVTAGQRVLVKNQTTTSENGLYLCAAGAWTRTTDGQVGTTLTLGSIVFVEGGTANGLKQFVLTSANTWSAYSAGTTYTASNGVTLVGVDFRIDASYTGYTNYYTKTQADTNFQPKDADLTAIAALAGATGLLRKTAADTWSLDTNTYLTANQTITLTGDVTGSGTTSFITSIAATVVTGKAIAGYTVGSDTALVATDTILQALQKLQGQVSARIKGTDTFFIGTTSIAHNRASGAQTLAGVSVDGSAESLGNTHDSTKRKIWSGTQAAYGAIGTKDANTVYHITDAAAPPRKYAAAIAGTATSEVITHNLNTRDVCVQIVRVASPYDTVECDIEMTTVNTITLRFAVAPAAGEYRIIVIG